MPMTHARRENCHDTSKDSTALTLIDELVRENGPWKNKARSVLNEAGPDDKTSLIEFVNWFEEGNE